MLSIRRVFTVIGLGILIVSLVLLAWAIWPTERNTDVSPVLPENLTLPTPQARRPMLLGWVLGPPGRRVG